MKHKKAGNLFEDKTPKKYTYIINLMELKWNRKNNVFLLSFFPVFVVYCCAARNFCFRTHCIVKNKNLPHLF